METFINVLEIVAFILKALLGMSVIVLLAMVGTYIHDEIKDMVVERSIELAKNREELSQLNTDDTTPFTEWVAKHRRPKAVKEEVTGRHRVIKGEPSYSSRNYAYLAPKQPIFNDDNFFESLIKERDELAPLWS